MEWRGTTIILGPYNSRLKKKDHNERTKKAKSGNRTQPLFLLIARETLEVVEARVLDAGVESVQPEKPALVLVPQLN